MPSIIEIFLLNVINDIDNVLVIAALLRKYRFDQYKTLTYAVKLYGVLMLTSSRTFYVLIIQKLYILPGLHLISGLIVFWIACRMISPTTRSIHLVGSRNNPRIPLSRLLAIILVTDLGICLDTVVLTAELSNNMSEIVLGIFFSLFLTFFSLNYVAKIFFVFPWLQVFAAGIMTQVAVLGIAKEPVIGRCLDWVQGFFDSINAQHIVTTIAIDAAIIVIIVGMVKLRKRD